MLEIRREQIQGMASTLCPEFIGRMASMLREDFPNTFGKLPAETVRSSVAAAIAQATAYGVFLEPDLTFYVRLQAVLGPEFDKDPNHRWARTILERGDLNGTEKMDSIHDEIVFSQAGCG